MFVDESTEFPDGHACDDGEQQHHGSRVKETDNDGGDENDACNGSDEEVGHFFGGKWKVESGKWKVERGKWKEESGKGKVGRGKWEGESGKRKVERGKGKGERE